MSPPIRDGSGSSIGSIRLGDGTEIAEVRTGAGDVLFSAIPDSAIFHWELSEGSGSTAADSIGSQDGTIIGATWDDTESWYEGFALDGDGSGDHVETGTWSTFGSSMDSDFCVLYTITTLDEADHMGTSRESGDDRGFIASNQATANASGGPVSFFSRSTDGGIDQAEGSTDITDGDIYRVALNKKTNDPSNWEIYINGSDDNASGIRTGATPTNYADFTENIPFLASNNQGTINDGINAVMDNIIVCDDSLTASEIADDHDNQPWS